MTFSKNTIALTVTGIIAIGFFVAGLFNVLDYFIVKLLLFAGFAMLMIYVVYIVVKQYNETKNHPNQESSE